MNKLLWVDLEMTGLDVEREVVIEIAAIITDLQFNELGSYHAIVKQPQKYLDAMDAWNQEHHGKSGLLAQIPEGKEPEVMEQEVCKFIQGHFQGQPAVLAGNSIFQDRIFIKKYFHRIEELLHYRMLDVTAWKLIFKFKHDFEYEKKNTHRAEDDIRESIAELKSYVNCIQVV